MYLGCFMAKQGLIQKNKEMEKVIGSMLDIFDPHGLLSNDKWSGGMGG